MSKIYFQRKSKEKKKLNSKKYALLFIAVFAFIWAARLILKKRKALENLAINEKENIHPNKEQEEKVIETITDVEEVSIRKENAKKLPKDEVEAFLQEGGFL